MNKVSCLSIHSNAALIWNTIEIGKLIDQLRLGGEEINDEDIAGISPLIFRHISRAIFKLSGVLISL